MSELGSRTVVELRTDSRRQRGQVSEGGVITAESTHETWNGTEHLTQLTQGSAFL